MSMLREDGLRLERPVVMEDMRAFHRECRHCYGSFKVVAVGVGGRRELPCRPGLREFAVATRGRVAEGPFGETWWIASYAPEQWGFTQMFWAGFDAWLFDRELAHQSRLWALIQRAKAKDAARRAA